ncbi:MAG TPA: hypothetical protein VIG06_21700 [Kofleriaceae bacterium]
MSAATRLAEGWRRYWFGLRAPISIEVVRVAVAVAALHAWNLTAAASYASLAERYPEGAYHPLGLLRLFGGDPPPVWCLETIKWLALAGAICLLVGLFTRASLVVTAISMCLLVGFKESFVKSWHHGFTPLLVALVAVLFAPAGRRFALDAVLRRRRGRPQPPEPPAWPILLAQVAAGLFFLNAVYWKLRRAGVHWAWSDSLRHHVLAQFDWAGRPRTGLADFLVHHEVAWKMAAAANMLTQAAPIIACFFIRRPLLRAFFGLFFIAETVLLDLVMDLPNYQWLPLVVVFVDWERLVAWVRRRLAVRRGEEPPPAPTALPPDMTPRARRLASAWIGLFLVVNLGIAFSVRGADVWLNLYPISQYTMFSQARAKQPYDVHQSWEFESIRFSIDDMEPGPLRAELERQMNKRFRRRWSVRDPATVKRLLAEARRGPRARPESLTATYAILVAPPYPAEPELEVHPVGILGRLVKKKTFRSLLGTSGVDAAGRHYIEPHPTGMKLPPGARITCILGNDPTLHDLEVQAEGDRLYYRPLGPGAHTFMAEVAGERFILATTKPPPADED